MNWTVNEEVLKNAGVAFLTDGGEMRFLVPGQIGEVRAKLTAGVVNLVPDRSYPQRMLCKALNIGDATP